VVLPDGATEDALVGIPQGPPDSGGWVPVQGDRGRDGVWEGFARPRTGEVRPLRHPALARADQWLWEGQYAYATRAPDGGLVLVLEGPEAEQTIPLGPVPAEAREIKVARRGTKLLVTIGGVPRFLVRLPATDALELPAMMVTASAETHVGPRSALVRVAGLPRWLVDLESGKVLALDEGPRVLPLLPAANVEMNERWAAGMTYRLNERPAWLPVWRVDLTTGQVVVVSFDGLLPLRPLGNCGSPGDVLQPDGTLAFGLRDDVQGGLHVGLPGSTPWPRIGGAIAAAVGVGGLRVGETWVVTASDGQHTFCPPLEAWTALAGAEPSLLRGSSVQVLPPGGAQPMLLDPQRRFWLHPSGRCLATEDGALTDLLSGAHTVLPPAGDVVWW
jgi:hypothetical protein